MGKVEGGEIGVLSTACKSLDHPMIKSECQKLRHVNRGILLILLLWMPCRFCSQVPFRVDWGASKCGLLCKDRSMSTCLTAHTHSTEGKCAVLMRVGNPHIAVNPDDERGPNRGMN